MFAKHLLPLLLAAALAPSARAGSSIELHFGKRTHNGNFVVSLSNGPHGYANHCAPKKIWVPAHFETQAQQVWVEGVEQKVWIAPVYGWRYDHCGKPYKVQLEVGHWKCVGSPGHFESQRVQVWVCGHWESCG
jgi:hypothetical protein